MRKAAQPLVKVENGRSAFAEHREIARVDQDVSVRDIKFAMKLVRVGYADDRQRVHRFERSTILSSLSRYVVGLVNEKAAIARGLIHRHAVNDQMLAIDHEEDTDFRRSPFSCGGLFPMFLLFKQPALCAVVGICTRDEIVLRRNRVPAKAAETDAVTVRSEEHTSELQSLRHLVCRLLLE